jgi:hypothetical protein
LSRDLDALRKYDKLEVHLLPGAVGLEAQMERAMQWVGDGYFITMSDTVKDIFVRLQYITNCEGCWASLAIQRICCFCCTDDANV